MRVLLQTPSQAVTATQKERPIDYHRRLPGYQQTPIVEVPDLAARLGVANFYVKNETSRYDLPSFKVLGASWATYSSLRDELGALPEGDLSPEQLRAWAKPAEGLTLVAASDGNHGRAVARIAQWFGFKSRIFLPGFVSAERIAPIEAEGAEIVVIDDDYDASVDAAIEDAEAAGTLLISDTARTADDEIPRLVAEGYTSAFAEIEEQIAGKVEIDVLAVQAGVGGLASAGTKWARNTQQANPTRVMVVEPEAAPCVFTALAAGEPVGVSAEGDSEMAVLQCGTVSVTAFPTLQAGVSCALAIEDNWALDAVEALSAAGISTGASGAAGAAGLIAACSGPMAGPIKDYLGIDANAKLLVVASESSDAGTGV